MHEFGAAFATAFSLITTCDPDLVRIVGLSLRVSLTAVALSALIGLPLGAAVAAFRFPGRRAVTLLLNTAMGLPPVVIGLIVYLILSRSGPLGVLGLLFTPAAMIVAQTVLIVPIIAALTRQVAEDLLVEYEDLLRVMGAGPLTILATLLSEARWSLLTTVLAGFGRASAEVGAVMIVGGNIDRVTRVMTTAIALETSKGDLPLALGLGIILMALSLTVNLAAALVRDARRA
ncbi:ABC transporter permease [Azospirillum rugosum]|uniref:Tungstate transport system permease protein n=1 Tax=Azospirillum rugosum TaxID=416170 RepID=A0ABS4SRQ6_9PROT|nr:ABC transporter permease [Azospirillum rugosum]MBP2294070.1 tungstate transport system permease protein [Azospirillum rugosum]MDQ0527541.1 tungstate transport system permease protein [Azospirillum rugosum]